MDEREGILLPFLCTIQENRNEMPLLFFLQVKDDQEEGEEEGGVKVAEAYNGQVQPSPEASPARGTSVASGGSRAKSYIKHSDSSFGLHSPDSFNDDVQVMTGGCCVVWSLCKLSVNCVFYLNILDTGTEKVNRINYQLW